METKKKKKKKFHYTVMITSDSAKQGVKKFCVSPIVGKVAVYIVGIVLALEVIYAAFAMMAMSGDRRENTSLHTQIEDLTKQNAKLQFEKDELVGKVSILSDTINQKVEEEAIVAAEIEEKSLPKGFPLGGTATMEEGENQEIPIAVFIANQGITVIASGNGTISQVGLDEEYGNVVKVDHGNGYVSLYRCESDAKVKEGDEVLRGTILFEMKENEQKLGYQILLNEEYIKPLDIMEIYG